jgi:hypothetical protein
MWCIAEIDDEYKERMYVLLDLYEEEYDPKRPVICLDEKPIQLINDKRRPIPMEKGKLEKYDYEYKRNGKANIFVAVDFKGGKRDITVTDRRTKKDFALYIRHLIDNVFPDVEKLRIVLDNLNIHSEKAIKENFNEIESNEIFDKIEFYPTPKHASWLNIAEIEINVMDIECTGRRIGDKETLINETTTWCDKRNEKETIINWKFTKKDADKKLSKHYINK